MFSFRLLFLLFIIVPFVEIYLLIEIGSAIGAPWTIFSVVLTAVIGAWLVRLQGLAALTRFQAGMNQGGLPAMELIEGVFLLVAGALLLTPGFFTDFIGFCFLTPPLRRTFVTALLKRGALKAAGVAEFREGSSSSHRSQTIEGEFRRMDD